MSRPKGQALSCALRAAAAENFAARLAAIWIVSPVAGLRPSRAARRQHAESTSENTTPPPRPQGRAALELPEPFAAVLDAYTAALAAAPLAAQTRRTYASKVRQYLAWLASAQTDGDPINTRDGRD